MSSRFAPLVTRPSSRLRRMGVPVASVMLGSAFTAAPVIALSPILPPVGLLLFLAWRLLRPELWPMWAGVPLGLFDDLMSGQPLGSGAFLWTMILLAIEQASTRLLWRDYWQDWLIATFSISIILAGGFLFARIAGGGGTIVLIVPQLLWSILLFPLAARICAMLDRWRLPR